MSYSTLDKQWFSQNLLFYRDEKFNSGKSLNITLSSSYQTNPQCSALDVTPSFNAPAILLSIGSASKTFKLLLGLSDILDIAQSIKVSIQGKNGIEIYKKIRGKDLYIKSEEVDCTKFEILVESDSCAIPVTNVILKTIYKIFENFILNYNLISIQYPTFSIMSDIRGSLQSITSDVRGILVKLDKISKNESVEKIEDPMIEEFEKFQDEYSPHISLDVPEVIESETEPKKDLSKINKKLILITKHFDSKIGNFYEHIFNLLDSNSFLITFSNFIIENNLFKESRDLLFPGIAENDLKSIVYVPKIIFTKMMKNHIKSKDGLSSKIPIMKYTPKHIKTFNKELSEELLIYLVFTKILNDRLSPLNKNIMENFSLLYTAMRTFLDPLIFTFLKSPDKNFGTYVNYLTGLYEDCLDLDIFTELLSEYKINEPPTIDEFKKTVGKFILGSTKIDNSIETIHKAYHSNKEILLPYDNECTLEQITKEIIPSELYCLNEDNNDIVTFISNMSESTRDIIYKGIGYVDENKNALTSSGEEWDDLI